MGETRWELPDYEHLRELGAGAAGRVVLATHRATGTPVAVKYLTGRTADHEGFRAEAELLGGLRSPHVAQLYEYVEGPQGAAIVMELVDGISLRDLLKAEGATGPEAALTVLKGSLLGLAAAHAAGVVHRDYKPANVLVAADGSSKLVDFGIALKDGTTGSVAGTPAYMAPEQWAGKPAAPTTDVYAATATFFECLTGVKPYAGTTLMELAVQHTEADIPAEQAPEALRPLILAGLAKTPEDRPDGAALLVEQLETVAGAAYGPDWEQRGRHRLAALVALLPFLLPTTGGAVGGTSFADTTVGPPGGGGGAGGGAGAGAGAGAGLPLRAVRRVRVVGAAAGALLVATAVAGVAVAGAPGSANAGTVAEPKVTTILGLPGVPSADPSTPGPGASDLPVEPSPSPSGSESPSASPSPSAATSSSGPTTPHPSGSATLAAPPTKAPPTTKAPGAPTATATVAPPSVPPSVPPSTPPAPSTAPPSPSPVLTTAPPAPLRVLAISGSPNCNSSQMTVSGTVTTDGAADGVLTLTWTSSASPRVPVTHTVRLPKGEKAVKFSDSMPFGTAFSRTVRLSTTPAATRGAGPFTLDTATCNPPR
ncbi:serine/threonine-protein kinase [Kitasatospora sp. NPDC096147]|uniref:serine/threonine-protein kinase n=1 Tax=Kitasatospora sp. NPDC096147 TaxID=3364093 RepID=UPI003805E218